MTQKEIHDSLDAMLENPKSRNFLNHLVRAYLPVSQVDKVWDKPKGPFKCVLTKVDLISVQEIMDTIQSEEYKHKFIENIKMIFAEDGSVTSASPIVQLIGNKMLGCTGTATTTFMSYPAFQEFYNWVVTKIFKNDKHICWLLKTINKEQFMTRAETIQDDMVQRKVKAIKQETVKPASFTLGELDSFKKLLGESND